MTPEWNGICVIPRGRGFKTLERIVCWKCQPNCNILVELGKEPKTCKEAQNVKDDYNDLR